MAKEAFMVDEINEKKVIDAALDWSRTRIRVFKKLDEGKCDFKGEFDLGLREINLMLAVEKYEKPIFEVHLEEWNHALHIDGRGHKSDVTWLLYMMRKYNVHPIIYRLCDWREENQELYESFCNEFTMRNHGVHHYYDEKADRSPYFNQEGYPFPPSGGFFFRFLPLWYLKWAIRKSGTFWIHPADFDEAHPKLKNPLLNFKRHVGLKGAKKKLEKLLQEVKFA